MDKPEYPSHFSLHTIILILPISTYTHIQTYIHTYIQAYLDYGMNKTRTSDAPDMVIDNIHYHSVHHLHNKTSGGRKFRCRWRSGFAGGEQTGQKQNERSPYRLPIYDPEDSQCQAGWKSVNTLGRNFCFTKYRMINFKLIIL